ncbi:SRPBCC family protein [Saccharopolyspora sp. K220]|uniref:SRPBCC family protein n=1 Tax=Saccharopolyspora soli TaxID=2926618 RepID=UPI001F582F59|nr:SRPBCC family protein [Saccharopolyspora soli]MCI2419182.1 SRPBCC family protein [Saccharopolyspora soli]
MNDSRFEPGPLFEADCLAADDRWALVLVRELRHPPEKVWAALTDPAQLREWAPYTANRDLGSTGDATLTMIDGDVAQDLAGAVHRAEPPTLLEYSWGTDVLRWELAATGTGTRLTLRHTVDGQDWVAAVAAGWHLCLVVAEHLLDGQPISPIRGADARNYGWEELHTAYADKLGLPNTGWPDHLES